MNTRSIQMALVVALALVGVGAASAAQSPGLPATATEITEWDKLVGQPVDIAPWAYAWRSDLTVQEKPEAYFIPRRLDRIDKVYRTFLDFTVTAKLPPEWIEGCYHMKDLGKPLLPPPKGRLLAGLLWTGGLTNYQVKLDWPANAKEIPSLETVEVRVYPTAWGWFGWTVDKVLGRPELSADRRTWTYKSKPGETMDWAYSKRVDAATEMVAVFYGEGNAPNGVKSVVPSIRVTGPSIGVWKRLDLEIEWGFQPSTEQKEFSGRLEPYVAMVGPVSPVADDTGTTVTGPDTWRSRAGGDARRGIGVPLLYAPSARPGLDSRVTVWTTKTDGFTFRVSDLEKGPILIPERGVFVTKAGSGKNARQFAPELAAKNLKGICQMTREHRETASWDELMRNARFVTCPPGTVVPPFPKVEDPPMQVQLPDPRWTEAWRTASFQLKGRHMWGALAFEVARVAHDMDLVGLHDEADKVYQSFLKGPGAKPDGDFTDGKGALEWARAVSHDIGNGHDGTHASTGRLLFGMAERYFLTGDKEWFRRNRVRMQAAADWIIRQRKLFMQDIPNRQDLVVAGLMPPSHLGDYAMPCSDWHWYYVQNALDLQGLQRFGDALTEFDPAAGRKYCDEADAFRADLRRHVDREAALSPVRLGPDCAYRSYISRMAYARGLTGPELGAPQFPDCDIWDGALAMAEPFGALDAKDCRMVDTLGAMEEMGASNGGFFRYQRQQRAALSMDDELFWRSYISLPKASHNANIFLLQDDVPNFLRSWMNSYACMVCADGKLWEGWEQWKFSPQCTAPDNGSAGWFLENFRNLLVMEDGRSLWVARATPRVWLEQGKKIAVQNAPTCFGTLAYEIVSDVDHGKITATIQMPGRNPPTSVFVRFRHPKAAPMKSVTVNGQAWKDFDPAKEVVPLHDVSGTVKVDVGYGQLRRKQAKEPSWVH